MKVMAIIPARSASKGIPRKHVMFLVGKPLLAHSIVHAKASPSVTRVVVSTDDAKIADVARQWGAEVVPRPPEISGDKASSESALLHALDYLKDKEGYEATLVVFLQATSPSRRPGEIEAAIETLLREKADSLFSACRVEGFTWRVRGGTVASVNYDPAHRPLRQELQEEIWEENGSFYIFKPWVLRKCNSRLGGKISMYRMSRLDSFQIDEPGDFEFLEHLMTFDRAEGRNLRPEKDGEAGGPLPGMSSIPSSISHLLSRIKLLVLDFDGVLTDNRVLVSEDGKEAVLCSREDGLGLEMLRKNTDIQVVVISKEKNPVVATRCRKLGIECIQGCDHKMAALKQLAVTGQWSVVGGLSPDQIAYVGDDINDLECMRWVGLPIAVKDAAPEARQAARLLTSRAGGKGAVREVTDLLIRRGA
jgi:N-acylneuraminate cytidylyltransferase